MPKHMRLGKRAFCSHVPPDHRTQSTPGPRIASTALGTAPKPRWTCRGLLFPPRRPGVQNPSESTQRPWGGSPETSAAARDSSGPWGVLRADGRLQHLFGDGVEIGVLCEFQGTKKTGVTDTWRRWETGVFGRIPPSRPDSRKAQETRHLRGFLLVVGWCPGPSWGTPLVLLPCSSTPAGPAASGLFRCLGAAPTASTAEAPA